MSYQDELYFLVKEINAKVAEARRTIRGAEQSQVVARLAGDLGTIAVSGMGELLAVSLNVDDVRNYTEPSLARQILQGIRQAEAEADHRRRAAIAAAKEGARFS